MVSTVGFLSKSFKNVYLIVGNHDLFYHRKREINSFPYAKIFNNVHVINDTWLVEDDVALVPWLVEDEWKQMKKIKTKYVFGHFEFPYFIMNAFVKMPNHQMLQAEHFKTIEYVFSGHFHKRQNINNIHYIGSPFGHNYADIWDTQRGAMFLNWGGDPEYVNFHGPKYIRMDLSELLEDPAKYLDENTFCRATLDVPITYEEAHFIRETFTAEYKPREFNLVPIAQDYDQSKAENEELIIESVDQIVFNKLNQVESDMVNKKILMDIYKDLDQ